MRTNKTPDSIWKEYQKAVAYNQNNGLYETVKKNEDFFIGNQWEGVNAPDLDKPVLNFLKRVVTYFISMIVSDDVGVSLTPFNDDQAEQNAAKTLSDNVERVMEQAGCSALYRDLLKSAAVDGEGYLYLTFDPEKETGQLVKGDISIECIDNTKVLFGNPYTADIQKQPYILLVQRRMLDAVKEEAKENGVDPDQVLPDKEDIYYGEEKDNQNDLTTVIIKLWKENGQVKYLKTTKDVVIKKEQSPGYTLYPLAGMQWEKIRNSYHGQAAITGLIPNQIFVNKLWAMAMEHQKKMAFPKLFYDMTKIPRWNNKVGQAIGVAGNPNEAVAQNFRAADMSNQVLELVDRTINYTRDFMGASDAALGNVKPDNTSAIIAVQKASSAPLELQRMAFYQCVEDMVRVILDLMRCHYGIRTVNYNGEDGTAPIEFDFGSITSAGMQLKIDVGAGAYWSELMQIQTMDNLFSKGIISDAVTYLEGIPDSYLNGKNKILEQLKQQQQMAEQQAALPMGTEEVNGIMPQM